MDLAALTRLSRVASLALSVGALGCVCPAHAQPDEPAARIGCLRADRILFLGNSITLHGVVESYGWLNYCGMAASVPGKDYVHVLTTALVERTHQALFLSPAPVEDHDADGTPYTIAANVLNVADIFERNYGTCENARLQPQLDARPDIVIMLFGENTPMENFDAPAFKAGLERLMDGLKAAGNPVMFVSSQVLGGGGIKDELKQQVCAQDPTHRIYVDLSSFGQDPTNLASAEPYYKGIIVGHPGDKGMAFIANGFLKAILDRAGVRED
jgi:hypothetical protein